MRRAVTALAIAALATACSSSDGGGASAPSGPWTLVWSDDFDGAALDATKWKYDVGSDFGTQQEDYDTARVDNVAVQSGELDLIAREESYQGSSYTSGRIETSSFTQAYGRFEIRAQLPRGQGMWPAFWLLGDNYQDVGWPGCGEIDVMEERGADPTAIAGSLHGPGNANYTQGFRLPDGSAFSDGFHLFAVEWEPGTIRWYVDDALYETRSQEQMPRSQPWVFDHPFLVIVDLAVGGMYGGPVDGTTTFPQTMRVDYVRVYARP